MKLATLFICHGVYTLWSLYKMNTCFVFFWQHAYALELLFDQLHEGAKALDVGSGSGILTACFARMVRALFSIWPQQKCIT